ncbi:fibronectin type III domain-containing protein [Candidatus Microgenomates bacterium]|nr:MAG: fibronectin type III domain-containing protein [Candidatus Microgenomates bacterium]
MKLHHFAILFVTLGVGVYLLNNNASSNVLGAKVVGNESREICWHGTQSAEAYQVYYGQADTGTKDSSIFNGLDNRSKCVTISYLKPCTTYMWNLLRKDDAKWSWQWESDQRFTTGGACETIQPVVVNTIVGNGRATVNWNVVDGASKYFVFYKEAGRTNWAYSADVPPQATTYTINYLSPNQAYVYRVAAVVDNELVWQAENNLVVY